MKRKKRRRKKTLSFLKLLNLCKEPLQFKSRRQRNRWKERRKKIRKRRFLES